jgi:hypothetical protein
MVDIKRISRLIQPVLLIAAFALSAGHASASHFRYSHITWRPTGNPHHHGVGRRENGYVGNLRSGTRICGRLLLRLRRRGVISGSRFFGVIDTGPIGFDEIQFREVDGRITDTFIIFADDFTLLAEPVDVAVPSLDALGLTALGCLLCAAAARSLRRGSSPPLGSP